MKITRLVIVFLLFFACHFVKLQTAYSQNASDSQSAMIDMEYVPSIGEKIYTLKADGTAARRIDGVIRGIKKNLDDTTFMIVEFRKEISPGAPVFFGGRIIGMVYNRAEGDLFEAIPIRLIVDFLGVFDSPFLKETAALKIAPKVEPKAEIREKALEDRLAAAKKHIEAQEYDSAIKILQDAIERDTGDAELHGWMGVALMETGNIKQATEEFKKAIAIEPTDADFHTGLGYAMLAADSSDEAIKSFKEAIRINPMSGDAHYGIGRAYLNMGDIKLATKEYMALKEIDNSMADSLFQIIMRSGSPETE